MDPPNVLWFAGTYAAAAATYGLLDVLPDSHRSLWLFLTALAFLAAYALAAMVLLRRGWWIPGGLATALAVGMVPGVAVGFLKLLDVWSLRVPFSDFDGYAFGVAVVTALAALSAFRLTRFPFVLLILVGAMGIAGQLLVAAAHTSSTLDARAASSLITGSVIVVVGVLLDAFSRRREAFWFHVGGWWLVALGLVFLVFETRDADRGWVPMLVLGVLLVIAAGPIRRATWAVYGVVGYYAALLHYLDDALNERRWPFALALLGLAFSLFALGMLQQRYGTRWNERFVRRPPPSIGTTP
jgi:hypothetical protein